MFRFRDETIKKMFAWSLTSAEKKSWHITRFYMYRKLLGSMKSEDAAHKSLLAISGSLAFARDILGLLKCRYESTSYPEVTMVDLPFADASFDFCVSDQVLEHVEGDPFKAIGECARILKPGGVMVHTTCFINQIHGVPNDFWRFTPNGLRLLAASANCETIAAEGWGNREAWALIQEGFRFEKLPDDETHPIFEIATRNEADYPIVVWLIARKPSV